MASAFLTACGSSPSTSALAQGAPTLGFPSPTPKFDPASGARGWGTIRPSAISNGGPFVGLTNIAWSTWGGAKAEGRGRGIYIPPGGSIVNEVSAPVVVVAFKLGTCDNHRVYTAVEWYYPSKGQAFNPKTFESWCNGLLHPIPYPFSSLPSR